MKSPYLLWMSVVLGFLLQIVSSYLSAGAFLHGDWAGGLIFFCLVLLLGFGILLAIVRFRKKKGPPGPSRQGPRDGAR